VGRLTYPSLVTARRAALGALLAALFLAVVFARPGRAGAAGTIPPPEQFIGFPVGADNKLARWDRIVAYMELVAEQSDRVAFRELGKTSGGNPFVVLEIAAPETLSAADRYKSMARQLYFQDGPPGAADRDEIFRRGKVVVAVTCGVHASEVGATQMSLELVHRLATDDSPHTRKILDNVILLLVPSANPDGQILVTDWFNRHLGTPYEASPLPTLDHPYAGHDINRDMYMLTQKESQYVARLMWQDWLPAIWLDEHQMGNAGPRIFVMPAGDPINPNVHPLIYRWNAILGQSQAAALEAAGKEGIIYNATYTNFWQGAMAWSGWWHNQIGLLTEVASVRVAAPVEQQLAATGRPPAAERRRDDRNVAATVLPPPTDVRPRTEYPRPWIGGRWTLRDIVDYELLATLATLETAADRRETILRQIYEVNRQTVEAGRQDGVAAIVVPVASQQDPREAVHLVRALDLAGVEVRRADEAFSLDGRRYPAGTFVVPMAQAFARYAKDLLEPQTYPGPRRGAATPPETPYDVTAWSLGMLLGVEVDFAQEPLPSAVRTTRVSGPQQLRGRLNGSGDGFAFDYRGPDTAIAVNRLLKQGAEVWFDSASHVSVAEAGRATVEAVAGDLGLTVTANRAPTRANRRPVAALAAPRVALYSPWGGNIDEGWTRWILEQYEFGPTTIHNQEMRAGGLRRRFDAVILPDLGSREMLDGTDTPSTPPEYRGGIGQEGIDNLEAFVAEGGTVIALGTAAETVIERLRLPVRNLKRGLRREQHYGPGTLLRLDVDTAHPLGFGMAARTYGFYNNGPFFALSDTASPWRATTIARFAEENAVASGWLQGEEAMAGRAAVMSLEREGGRVVLFGVRPQHRAQTHATFPLLFNALFLAAAR
jgi:hypothetical protein